MRKKSPDQLKLKTRVSAGVVNGLKLVETLVTELDIYMKWIIALWQAPRSQLLGHPHVWVDHYWKRAAFCRINGWFGGISFEACDRNPYRWGSTGDPNLPIIIYIYMWSSYEVLTRFCGTHCFGQVLSSLGNCKYWLVNRQKTYESKRIWVPQIYQLFHIYLFHDSILKYANGSNFS